MILTFEEWRKNNNLTNSVPLKYEQTMYEEYIDELLELDREMKNRGT